MLLHNIALLAFAAQAMALADPLITAAAELAPRATDPSFVGYISAGGSFADGRTCGYPQTVSTSGSFVQCCSATGPCPFYTACSSNTLVAEGTEVPCDIDAASTCNTGIVLPTAGAAGGPSFLACWQRTLGSSAFTFVQDIGSATVAPAPTTSQASSGPATSSSSASRTTPNGSSPNATSARASSASTASTPNAAVGADAALNGGLIGAIAMLAQALL